ncbi:hypothetical protein EVAR_55282_1 [Eumeta japonica]|uniref:Uncharacterized protein n=1 Tax=Eumeta variegata TaxID=151549 RepID=A0A4C1ZIH8_EUMVA|nr:hypothetical protein EVAR_55282_1 [Eumeta japonica]
MITSVVERSAGCFSIDHRRSSRVPGISTSSSFDHQVFRSETVDRGMVTRHNNNFAYGKHVVDKETPFGPYAYRSDARDGGYEKMWTDRKLFSTRLPTT